MKKLSYFLLPFIFIGCNTNLSYNDESINSESNTDSEECKVEQEIVLKNSDKNIVFTESRCFEDKQSVLVTKYQLKNDNSNFTFDKKYNESDTLPNNEAISLYKSKNHGLTLLSITSWNICCFPKAEGVSYEIDIYQLNKSNDGYQAYKIPSNEIDFETYGFEGDTFEVNGKSYFELKTIHSIKNKLKILDF